MDIITEAEKKYQIKIEKDVILSGMTTWGIGGPAKYFARAQTILEVIGLLKLCKESSMSHIFLGGGSNVLISDLGFNGLVIKNDLNKISFQEDIITAESGVPFGKMVAQAHSKRLGGLEWAAGLPGSVGGAVFGNSNSFGGSTAERLVSVTVIDKEFNLKTVDLKTTGFSYDNSGFQKTGDFIASARFKLDKLDQNGYNISSARIREVAEHRVAQQPHGKKCAGSVFKSIKITDNIKKAFDGKGINWQAGMRDGLISSGFIIDKALGLRGKIFGNVQVSDLHANFLINLGGAGSQDIKKVIDFVKKECKNDLGIVLEEEIRYLGNF